MTYPRRLRTLVHRRCRQSGSRLPMVPLPSAVPVIQVYLLSCVVHKSKRRGVFSTSTTGRLASYGEGVRQSSQRGAKTRSPRTRIASWPFSRSILTTQNELVITALTDEKMLVKTVIVCQKNSIRTIKEARNGFSSHEMADASSLMSPLRRSGSSEQV